MSDTSDERKEGNQGDPLEDDEVPDSQEYNVDTEPVFPLSQPVEQQSSCETNLSQESNGEDVQEDLEQGVLKEEVATPTKLSSVNSSLEVEANQSIHNVSLQEAKGDPWLPQGQESSQDDIFQERTKLDKSSSPTKNQSTKKRKGRSHNYSPITKRSRLEDPVNLESSQDKHSFEVVFEGIEVKKDSGPVLEISSTPEKTIILDDSQEFSLRVEDTSPPATEHVDPTPKESQESVTWKTHSKEKNSSPSCTGNSLSQKSGSWSSHHNNEHQVSWCSHKATEDKYTLLKKEHEELKKELERLRHGNVSPESPKAKESNPAAAADSKVRVVVDEHPLRAVIHWTLDDKTNKIISAEIKQISLLEEHQVEKPNRMSVVSSTSHKSSSSSGSVGLPGPFPLPGYTRLSVMSSVSSSTTSSGGMRPGWDGPFLKPSVPGSKAVVVLSCGLCNKPYPTLEQTSAPILNGSPKLSEEEEAKVKPATPRRPKKRSSATLSSEEESSGSQPQAASTPTLPKPRGRPRKHPVQDKAPKNGVAKSVKSETPTLTSTTDEIPSPVLVKTVPSPVRVKSAKGEAVFAKWADGRYYPGFVKSRSGSQALVHFCDGQTKLLPVAKVIRADIITSGTLVLAGTDSGEYEEALTIEVDTSNSEPQYQVERGNEAKLVQFCSVALLESQVTELTMTDTQKAAASLNFNDLSLENIIAHPRKRSARANFAELARGSPISSPSAKKKKRQTTPEPSTSHGQTFNGPDDYYMDTDSSTHSICSLDLRGKEMKPLDIECSPPEVDSGSRIKLSHYRRNMTPKLKKKGDEPKHLVELLGPIPEPGSELFAGCIFLITYTVEVEIKNLCDTGTDSGSENQHPVWKERLRTQIKSGGGKVYNSLSHVAKEELPHTYLITDKPCNTPLYLQCLVHGVPIYSTALILKCCTQNRPWKELIALRSTKKLQAGYSLVRHCLVNPRSTTPLCDKTILLALTGEPSLTTFWQSLIRHLGATSEIYKGSSLVEQRFDVIVTDGDCDRNLVMQASEQKVPLVSITWLQQCIINGDYRSPTEHPLYKYNCSPGEESPVY